MILETDKKIFGIDGLGVDSVDTLEIILGIKKHFNLDLKNSDAEFFATHFDTIGSMIDYIQQHIQG